MGTVEDIQIKVAERVKQEFSADQSNLSPEITNQFISSCLSSNELGDAQLYILLNKGKRLYNQTSGEWLRWAGHYWEVDRGSADALAAMEGVVAEYLKYAKHLVDQIAKEENTEAKNKLIYQQKMIYRRVDRLRSVGGCNNCLTFTTRCHDRMVCSNEDIDQKPWLMPVNNGVIDLQTGDIYPGNPDDLLMKCCPHDWTGINTSCALWETALFEIMSDNQDMVDFLARLLGYSITGMCSEQILPVFWGKGRNGKGTIIEILSYILGSYAAPIASEMLMAKAFARSSSGPSPDIMALKGLRIAFASESDEGRRIDVNMIKKLTGGDTLVGRCPHDKYETTFTPTHKLFLLTNNKPHAPADDFAFWQRMVLVPFLISYVDEPRSEDHRKKDKFLMDKLKKEANGILAWLVRGCLRWQESGLDYPLLVREATGEYQKGEDMLGDFLDETCLMGDEYRESSARLYDAFRKWFETNYGKKIPSHRRFGELMVKKFKRIKYGVNFYVGLKLSDLNEEGEQGKWATK